jgi:TRAP-type mannitol/chloroaromatic compound transport system substrate-binding protein
VAKYYYYPGIHEPGIAFALGINREFWNSLSLSQREAVVAAAESETVLTQAEFDAGSADALDVLKRNHFIEPRKMPDDVLIAIGEAAGQVVAEAAAFDATTRAVYEAYIAYRQKSVAWSKLSIQAYMDARLLPFRYSR